MENLQDIFHQVKNRKFVKETLGREIWIQVCGDRELNSAHALFWTAFIPLENVASVLNCETWDSIRNTQTPGFAKTPSEVVYYRIPKDFCACENVVHFRNFYGIKPEYVEIVEEFRLLNNLYHDVTTNIYFAISENGEPVEVAKIENNTCAFIKLEYLMRYAAARQMAFLLFFDIQIRRAGTLEDNGVSKLFDEYQDNNLIYRIIVDEYDSECYSSLMGKRIIYPPPVEECGYWPYTRERHYENFIVGIDEYGKPIKFTCNPNMLSSYFQKQPAGPSYLTPVFFKKEVLQRYLSHHDLYSVEDGYLRCHGLWGMHIDNHHMDYVCVYLGDLGRDLPAEEQSHWLQYNVAVSEKLSKVAYERDFLCKATDSDIFDIKFKNTFYGFQKKWKEKFGWYLFLPLTASDEYNISLLHIPYTNNQQEFDNQVLSLVKTIIDSLNEKEIDKQIKNHLDLKGSISKLEHWLTELGIQKFESHIKFLRNLQELRSSGTGHRKGKNYDKIKKEFCLSNDNFKTVFDNILCDATTFLLFLTNKFSL